MRPIPIQPARRVIAYVLASAFLCSTASADNAPIRYGHKQNSGSETSQTTSSASAVSVAALSSPTDEFYYPDEPIIPRSGGAPVTAPFGSEARRTVSGQRLGLDSLKDPALASSYKKVGTPYTIAGKTYVPKIDPFYDRVGMASWYGPGFDGGLTAMGETFDMYALTAAHPTLPLPSYVRVTNLENGLKTIVRVNDRGPFRKNRIIDLSQAAAERLDMIDSGSSQVRVEFIGPAEGVAPPTLAEVEDMKPSVSPADARIPQTHFLQLGSFAERSNADTFRRQVEGYADDAAVVFAEVNGARRYRVVVGPFTSKTAADDAQKGLARRGLNGLVIQNPRT